MNEKEYIYRFRPTRIFLSEGKEKSITEELLNQEIFLSSIDENNDPIDGYLDIYYEADNIIWQNLIKQFSLALFNTFLHIAVIGTKDFNEKFAIDIWITKDNLPSIKDKLLFDQFYDELKEDTNIKKLHEILIYRKKIHNKILINLFLIFFNVFLSKLAKIEKEKFGTSFLINQQELTKEFSDDEINAMKNSNENVLLALSEISLNRTKEFLLRFMILNTNPKEEKIGLMKFISSFPVYYFIQLEKVLFPEYYISCFSKTYKNNSMWGKYAESHKGICLIFDRKKSLNLDNKNLSFYDVKYNKTPRSINFFDNLGSFTMPIIKAWFFDEVKKEYSSYHEKYCGDGKKFRDEYWERFLKKTTHKHDDWSHEEEIRCVLYSGLSDKIQPEKRLNKYKINQLKGIAFGKRIDESLKIDIIKALSKIVSDDFNFYQTEYSSLKKELVLNKIRIK